MLYLIILSDGSMFGPYLGSTPLEAYEEYLDGEATEIPKDVSVEEIPRDEERCWMDDPND